MIHEEQINSAITEGEGTVARAALRLNALMTANLHRGLMCGQREASLLLLCGARSASAAKRITAVKSHLCTGGSSEAKRVKTSLPEE